MKFCCVQRLQEEDHLSTALQNRRAASARKKSFAPKDSLLVTKQRKTAMTATAPIAGRKQEDQRPVKKAMFLSELRINQGKPAVTFVETVSTAAQSSTDVSIAVTTMFPRLHTSGQVSDNRRTWCSRGRSCIKNCRSPVWYRQARDCQWQKP